MEDGESVVERAEVRGESEELGEDRGAVLEAVDDNVEVGLFQLFKRVAGLQQFEEFLMHWGKCQPRSAEGSAPKILI